MRRPPFRPEEPAALLLDLRRADGLDAEELLRGREVDIRLLGLGVEVEEDDVLGVVRADDGAAEEVDEATARQPREVGAEPGGRKPRDSFERFVPGVGLHHLERRERGEALKLDQLRRQGAVRAGDDRQVDLREGREGVHPGGIPLARDEAPEPCEGLGPRDLREDPVRCRNEALLQLVREEDGRLGEAEARLGPGAPGEVRRLPQVELFGEGVVERVAPGRMHRGAV